MGALRPVKGIWAEPKQHPLQTRPGFASWLFHEILSQGAPTMICTVDLMKAQWLPQLTFIVTLCVPVLARVLFSHSVFIEHLLCAGAVLNSGETWNISPCSFPLSAQEQFN